MTPLLAITLVTALYMLSIGIIIPVLPFFILDLGGGPVGAALAFSIFSFSAFLSAPLWGRLSDKINRKPVLLLSALTTALGYILLLQADTLLIAFLARIIAGMGAGWLVVSQAFIADITSTEDRSKGMGFLGAAAGAGFTIGPAIAALTAGLRENPPHYDIAFLICLLTIILAALTTVFLIKEPTRHRPSDRRDFFPFIQLLHKKPELRQIFLFWFLILVAFEGIGAIFAPWFKLILGRGPADLALILGFSGLISILVQGNIHKIANKIGEKRLIPFAILLMAIAMVGIALNKHFIGIFVVILFLTVGVSLFMPLMQSLVSRKAPPDIQGSILGSFQSIASLSRILGPALTGFAFSLLSPAVPFFLSAILCLIVLVFLVKARIIS